MSSRFGLSERQSILKRHVYLFLAEEMPDCAVGLHPRKRFPSSRRFEASVQMHLALQVAKAADNITPPRSVAFKTNQSNSLPTKSSPKAQTSAANSHYFTNASFFLKYLTAPSSFSSQPIKPPRYLEEIQETGSYLPSISFCKPIVRLKPLAEQ